MPTTTLPAEAFAFFGADHWLALFATAIVAVGLVLAQRFGGAASGRLRGYVCRGLAIVLIGSWTLGQWREFVTGVWTIQESLPLHLCDIGLWVTAITLLIAARGPSSTGQVLFEFAYFWGLGGTLQALLTPDVQEPFPAFMSVRFFVTHGGIVVGVLYLALGLGMRPRPRSPMLVWLGTLTLAVVVLGLNWLSGGNYMYLCGPPERASIIDYLGPWPWTLLGLMGIGTVFIALWYTPYWIADRWRGIATADRSES